MCSVSGHGNVIYISYIFRLCSLLELTLVGWLESLEMFKIEHTLSWHTKLHCMLYDPRDSRLEILSSIPLECVYSFHFCCFGIVAVRFLLVKLFSAPPPPPHALTRLCAFLSHVDVWMFLVRTESEFRIRERLPQMLIKSNAHSNSTFEAHTKILFEQEEEQNCLKT